jgi:hypothetical protein
VPDRCGVDPAHRRHRREDRRVAGATRDHDFGAVLQRLHERLDSRHADDVLAAIDDCVVEVRGVRERRDPAFVQLALQILLALLTVYRRELEAQLLFARDLACDANEPRHLRVGAGRARRADDHRDFRGAACEQHEAQVAFIRRIGKERVARAEVMRPRVGRARIGADEIGLERHRALHRLFPEAGAEDAGRGKDSDFFHGGNRSLLKPYSDERRCRRRIGRCRTFHYKVRSKSHFSSSDERNGEH